MDTFGNRNLRRLISVSGGPCVSLYLPTHPVGEEGQQDPIRLKNLLQVAESQLAAKWVRSAVARDMLKNIRTQSAKPDFWQKRSSGLAVFLGPSLEEEYRLPISFEPQVCVDHRFHLLPVLPMVMAREHFFVLTLSQNAVRLFSATRHEIEQIEVPDLPAKMRATLNYTAVDRGSQVHSAMRGAAGKQGAVFHGQGGQADTLKADLELYFRQVDAALQPILRDETSPLLLVGVEYLLPIYRTVCTYPVIADQELHGNWDHLTPVQLLQLAWPLMVSEFERTLSGDASRYLQWAGTGRATGNLTEIVAAAYQGRVETLFADTAAHLYGVFDPTQCKCELHAIPQEGDNDLLDEATRQTILHHGTVYAVGRDEVPSGDIAAALLRY